MEVIAIIADIVRSKKIEDRKNFQLKLKNELDKVNISSNGIISPYTITIGDEFQAVYNNGENILNDIINLLTIMQPVKIRFAIGFSTIETEINSQEAIGMDGPAFHVARNGINELKKNKYSLIQFYGKHFSKKPLINNGLKYSMSIMDDWKKNTLLIFNELLKGKPIKEIVPIVKISQRGVYKIIETHNLVDLKNYFFSMEDELKNLKGKE